MFDFSFEEHTKEAFSPHLPYHLGRGTLVGSARRVLCRRRKHEAGSGPVRRYAADISGPNGTRVPPAASRDNNTKTSHSAAPNRNKT